MRLFPVIKYRTASGDQSVWPTLAHYDSVAAAEAVIATGIQVAQSQGGNDIRIEILDAGSGRCVERWRIGA